MCSVYVGNLSLSSVCYSAAFIILLSTEERMRVGSVEHDKQDYDYLHREGNLIGTC